MSDRIVVIGLVWVLLGAGGCAFSVTSTDGEESQVVVELSAFPDRIAAEDSLARAEVWATVRQGGRPVDDNTVVFFATHPPSYFPNCKFSPPRPMVARLIGFGEVPRTAAIVRLRSTACLSSP